MALLTALESFPYFVEIEGTQGNKNSFRCQVRTQKTGKLVTGQKNVTKNGISKIVDFLVLTPVTTRSRSWL